MRSSLLFYDRIQHMNNLLKAVGLCALLCMPFIARAQIVISEIMYDLQGPDTDREWIEIQNTSSSDVDISLLRFGEGTTNHKLAVVQGNQIVPPGGYAIIVEKLESFKTDWPQFGGTIFDSSFSLSNTGETLVMRDADLKDIDTVSYTADKGGAGDGRTLQKVAGSWVAGMPTPGAANVASAAPASAPPPPSSPPTPTSSPSSGAATTGSTASSVSPPLAKSIRPVIDTSITTIVGGRADFRGSAYGFENKPLENVRFLWNFGDGGIAEGEHVLHTYSFPGRYEVVLSVASGEFSGTVHGTIEAIQADVRFSRMTQNGEAAYIVYNNLKENIDLSGWRIVAGETTFSLPERTFVVSQGRAVFPAKLVGLSAVAMSFSLLYPNGTLTAMGADEQVFPAVSVQMPTEPANLLVQTPVVKKETAIKSTLKKKIVSGKKEEVAVVEHAVATQTEPISELAAVDRRYSVGAGDNASVYKWLFVLTLLIALGAGAAVSLRKKEDDSITLVD